MRPSINPSKAENLYSYDRTFATLTENEIKSFTPETREFFGIVLKGDQKEQTEEKQSS